MGWARAPTRSPTAGSPLSRSAAAHSRLMAVTGTRPPGSARAVSCSPASWSSAGASTPASARVSSNASGQAATVVAVVTGHLPLAVCDLRPRPAPG